MSSGEDLVTGLTDVLEDPDARHALKVAVAGATQAALPRPWHSHAFTNMRSKCPHCKEEITHPDGAEITTWIDEEQYVVATLAGRAGAACASLAVDAVNERDALKARIEEIAIVCHIVAQQAGAMDTLQRNGAALTPEDWRALRQGYTNAYDALTRVPDVAEALARVGAVSTDEAEQAEDTGV